MWRRAFARIHNTRSSTCATIERICGKKKKNDRRYREAVFRIYRDSPRLDKITREDKRRDSTIGRERERERGEGRKGDDMAWYIRVKVVCFYVSGRPNRRLSRTYRARSCRALLLHMKSHCARTHVYIRARTIQMHIALRLACLLHDSDGYGEGPIGDRFSLSASVATRTSAKRRIILE